MPLTDVLMSTECKQMAAIVVIGNGLLLAH